MPYNEKEYNCYLFDQLSILERKEIAFERRQIERKLYQQPSIKNEIV